MRLIDADEFKKQIAGMAIINNYPADKANKICELIDCRPTAYDMDKVVGQLENLGWVFADYYPDGTNISRERRKSIPYDRAIEIVKSGGVADE